MKTKLGRPPLKGGPSQVFRFKVSTAEVDAMKDAAAALGITPSELVRRAVAVFRSLPKSIQESAR